MHATLAYLNAAATRKVRSTPRNRAFWKVMHSLLATGQGVSQRPTKPSVFAARAKISAAPTEQHQPSSTNRAAPTEISEANSRRDDPSRLLGA
jgi:hypothetical protein